MHSRAQGSTFFCTVSREKKSMLWSWKWTDSFFRLDTWEEKGTIVVILSFYISSDWKHNSIKIRIWYQLQIKSTINPITIKNTKEKFYAMNATASPPRVDFSNMVGPKRRRMRSGGNVSTITNNTPKDVTSSMPTSIDDEKTVQTSKCKGSTAIPIFLKSEWAKRSKADGKPLHDCDEITTVILRISKLSL